MLFLESSNLLLLFFPALLLFFSLRNPPKRAHQLFSEHILKRITRYPELRGGMQEYRLLLMAIALFILALAQPVLMQKSQERSFAPLVIALDISNSMNRNAIYPNRLSFAKKKLLSLVEKNPKLKLSLLLFAKDAYLASPMSEDLGSFEYVLSNVDLEFHRGSNLFAALEGAEYILKDYRSKNLLLLTDGTSTSDFTREKSYLQEHKIRLYTLLLNSEQTSYKALQKLSKSSGGLFQKYSFSELDIETLLKEILRHKELHKGKTKEKKNYTALFYYPLVLALSILLFIFLHTYRHKRLEGSFALVCMLTLCLTGSHIYAALLDFSYIHTAKKAYEESKFEKSLLFYKKTVESKERNYNLANTLYKMHNYKEAISTYKKALSKESSFNADIYYNIANAYVHLKKFRLAKKSYIQSLHLKEDRMAQENLENLLLFMKKLHRRVTKIQEKYKLPKNMSMHIKEMPKATNSNYIVKLKSLIPQEEKRWIEQIQRSKPTIFLQKLPTKRVSYDANNDD